MVISQKDTCQEDVAKVMTSYLYVSHHEDAAVAADTVQGSLHHVVAIPLPACHRPNPKTVYHIRSMHILRSQDIVDAACVVHLLL